MPHTVCFVLSLLLTSGRHPTIIGHLSYTSVQRSFSISSPPQISPTNSASSAAPSLSPPHRDPPSPPFLCVGSPRPPLSSLALPSAFSASSAVHSLSSSWCRS